MTQPIENARRRPIMLPILPPVIISVAITSVYRVMAVCTPVTVVPTSFATCAMETFITELSSVIRNCARRQRQEDETRPAPDLFWRRCHGARASPVRLVGRGRTWSCRAVCAQR